MFIRKPYGFNERVRISRTCHKCDGMKVSGDILAKESKRIGIVQDGVRTYSAAQFGGETFRGDSSTGHRGLGRRHVQDSDRVSLKYKPKVLLLIYQYAYI